MCSDDAANTATRPVFEVVLQLPLGWLGVRIRQGTIVEADLLSEEPLLRTDNSPLVNRAASAVERWLHGEEIPDDLPLRLAGTPFQQRVWQALRQIPRGEVRTYGELARQLGSSPRAVGGACRANPLPVFVPCHRVVSAQGLGGFSGAREGYLVDLKRSLLRLERVEVA